MLVFNIEILCFSESRRLGTCVGAKGSLQKGISKVFEKIYLIRYKSNKKQTNHVLVLLYRFYFTHTHTNTIFIVLFILLLIKYWFVQLLFHCVYFLSTKRVTVREKFFYLLKNLSYLANSS